MADLLLHFTMNCTQLKALNLKEYIFELEHSKAHRTHCAARGANSRPGAV